MVFEFAIFTANLALNNSSDSVNGLFFHHLTNKIHIS